MKRGFVGLFLYFVAAGFLHAEVFVNETFDASLGKVTIKGALKRAAFVKVEAGTGAIGTDPAVHFLDDSTEEAGILEYNVGDSPSGAFFISFDLVNNAPDSEKESMRLIFSLGQWLDGKNFILSGGAKRAFSMELEQAASSKALSIRIGTATAKKSSYDTAALQQVKIWVNDNDKKELPYIRPDTQQEAVLNPDSVVIWINDQLAADQLAGGVAMQSSVSTGDAVLGRLGFSSSSTALVDFWIDNLHIESISR